LFILKYIAEENFEVKVKLKENEDMFDSHLKFNIELSSKITDEKKKESCKIISKSNSNFSSDLTKNINNNNNSHSLINSEKDNSVSDHNIVNKNGSYLEKSSGEDDEGGSGSASEENSSKFSKISIPKYDQNDNIYEYYEYLRKKFQETTNQWEDPEFPDDQNLFGKNGVYPEKFKENNIELDFERPNVESDEIYFFAHDSSPNIDYEFKIKRGLMSDKFFIGSILMLFRKKEEFFTNLVLDYDHIKENINAGFCGFQFFLNGEWRNITVDTRLPCQQSMDEMALSMATSNKNSFWLSLFEKAYSKAYKTYDVLNTVSIKNTLVELTGGVSKKILINEIKEDHEKKNIFDEIKRCLAQKYLIGCMKYDEQEEDVNS
jgi:hypothetical protein